MSASAELMPESSSVTTGILLNNLGTPDAPTPAAVRRFLGEMLSDRKIVDLPPLLWQPILRGIVLRTRPRRSAEAYEKVWTPEGSPQLVIARRLAARLRESMGLTVEVGMTYGNPSIRHALETLMSKGATQVIALSLYPQYSETTIGAAAARLNRELKRIPRAPATRLIDGYYSEPTYIDALRQSVEAHWQAHGRPEHLLMSYHGIPQRNSDRGDPYRQHCETTSTLLAQALGLQPDQWSMSFQSRFGTQEWLHPYTDERLKELAQQGIRHLGVICPGFSLDCLETLEEIVIRGESTFRERGGQILHYIPSLNDTEAHVRLLSELIQRPTSRTELKR